MGDASPLSVLVALGSVGVAPQVHHCAGAHSLPPPAAMQHALVLLLQLLLTQSQLLTPFLTVYRVKPGGSSFCSWVCNRSSATMQVYFTYGCGSLDRTFLLYGASWLQ
eukprot:3922031-Amphidinium_carterae.2